MALINSVGRFITAANNKADLLTAGAKIALCLPSFLSNLPGVTKQLIGNVVATIGTTLEGIVESVSDIVLRTINGAVQQITGAIVGNIDAATSALAQLGAIIKDGKDFYKGIKRRVGDIDDFINQKQNCDFAAATLLNCITSQALASVTPKIAIDVSKGLRPIRDVVNEVSNNISKPGGAINRTVNKAAREVDRATRIVETANLF